jgi:drug/metabolite transporter (DMT)-like permease
MTTTRLSPPAMGTREWVLLLALSVVWGGSFFFTGVAVHALPAFTIVLARVGIAAVALNLAVRAAGLRMPRDARSWGAFLGMGALNNAIPFALLVWGQHHIASGLAAILNATTPLSTVLVAHWLTADEKLTPAKLAGVAAGLVGVVVMLGPDRLGGLGGAILAELACLAAAISYAFAGVFGRRFRRMGILPLVTAAGQVTASTRLILPLALVVDRPWTLPVPGIDVGLALAGIGLLSTALAYVMYFRILAAAGATNLLLVTFLIPVSAILLGTLVLGEHLAPRDFVGMALIGAGLAAIDGRLLPVSARRLRPLPR